MNIIEGEVQHLQTRKRIFSNLDRTNQVIVGHNFIQIDQHFDILEVQVVVGEVDFQDVGELFEVGLVDGGVASTREVESEDFLGFLALTEVEDDQTVQRLLLGSSFESNLRLFYLEGVFGVEHSFRLLDHHLHVAEVP